MFYCVWYLKGPELCVWCFGKPANNVKSAAFYAGQLPLQDLWVPACSVDSQPPYASEDNWGFLVAPSSFLIIYLMTTLITAALAASSLITAVIDPKVYPVLSRLWPVEKLQHLIKSQLVASCENVVSGFQVMTPFKSLLITNSLVKF